MKKKGALKLQEFGVEVRIGTRVVSAFNGSFVGLHRAITYHGIIS